MSPTHHRRLASVFTLLNFGSKLHYFIREKTNLAKMGITWLIPPCNGLVVWFTVNQNEQPWPALITACSASGYLVTMLGREESTSSAELHQLSKFECNLSNAVVPYPNVRTELSAACAAALDHANSEAGVPVQHTHLSSPCYAKFLSKFSQEMDELLPEWSPWWKNL